MFESLKVSTRLLVAFGGAASMVGVIAAVAAVQIDRLAQQAGTAVALQAGQEATRLVALLALMAATGGVVVAVWLMRSLSRDLGAEPRELAACARRVADGDLAPVAPAGARGVMSDLERMRDQLATLVAAVHVRADAVAGTSADIASTGVEISRRTEAQAAELADAAERMQDLVRSARRSTDSAQQALQQAHEARAAAEAGRAEIGRAALAMQAMTDGTRRIDDIAGLIDGLAAQTGILALNAAAAAARAGNAGNEFAVVAHEVRALAQRVSTAAADVKALTSTNADLARDGDVVVRRAVDAMERIVAIVAVVAANTEAIGRSSDDQGGEIARLGSALCDLDARLRDSASLVASNAGAAGSLDVQASELLHAVAAFRCPGLLPASPRPRNPRPLTAHRAEVGAR